MISTQRYQFFHVLVKSVSFSLERLRRYGVLKNVQLFRPPCITAPTPHHSIFTGRMLFLTPNEQCQSAEGTGTEGTDDN